MYVMGFMVKMYSESPYMVQIPERLIETNEVCSSATIKSMQIRLISDVDLVLFDIYLDLWMDWSNVGDKSDYIRSSLWILSNYEHKIDKTTYNWKINSLLRHYYLLAVNYNSLKFRVLYTVIVRHRSQCTEANVNAINNYVIAEIADLSAR